MERKPKGYKGPTWVEWVMNHKESRGVSFRAMARECDMSDASWHALITGKGPPNLPRAKQIADFLRSNSETTLNIVFKDRLLRWFKKEGILSKPPTPAIEHFLQKILSWDPTSEEDSSEEDAEIRYIMSTYEQAPGMEIARSIGYLPDAMAPGCNEKRSELFRTMDFR